MTAANRVAFTAVAALVLWAQPGAAQTGSLYIASDPQGADVYIDDVRAGVTPVRMERPLAGSHRIRLVKAGYLENVRDVKFAADRSGAIGVTLTPTAGAELVSAPRGAEESSAPTTNWFVRRKWIWIGAAGGAAAGAIALNKRNAGPPIAGSIIASPAVGLQGATAFIFAAQGASDSSGRPLEYSWNFGDATSGSGPLVTHVYNSAGTFNVTVAVSNGKHSATAGGATVVVRDLAGTWRGTVVGAEVTLTLIQAGTALTGVFRDPGATGTVAGAVRSASPQINLTLSTPTYSATYAADPNGNVDTLSGIYREQGLTLTVTLARQ